MFLRLICAALILLMAPLLHAQGEPASVPGTVRYISDETAITLRAEKGMNAEVAGLLKSGARVDLLENDKASGYARVRVAPGREGWVLARYLSTEPAARERLAAVQSQLDEQLALVRRLQGENARLGQARAASAPPAQAAAAIAIEAVSPAAADASGPAWVNLLTGAGLFVVGLLAGLLIPMIPRSPRRRWTAEL